MPYSALRGTISAQGYALQLPPARRPCPTVLSVAQSLRRGMLYSYPLRADPALQCPQLHFVCAWVAPDRRKQPFREDPARVVCPTVHSVAHSLCRGMLYSYPLRADPALQGTQRHFPRAGVAPKRQKPPFREDPARWPCPTAHSEAQSLRRGMLYSYPLHADHALQSPQWHNLCAGVSSTTTPCTQCYLQYADGCFFAKLFPCFIQPQDSSSVVLV